jgi:MerR family transcriptional regulator, thiopeptide resistance regulator
MLRVSQIAKRGGLSRTTILYYEACALLKPALRSSAKYRLYGDREVRVLDQTRLYRSVGMSIDDIRLMLSSPENEAARLLKRRPGGIGRGDSAAAWASGSDSAVIAQQGHCEED